MMSDVGKHNNDLYNTLLVLSRNIFFYTKIGLSDSFQTRIYLMFMHFSIMMIICKKKKVKFDQKSYDLLFNKIENNLRELGYGDVAVNKKMKELNKILYDILLKIEIHKNIDKNGFKINHKLILNYFDDLKDPKTSNFKDMETYFCDFYHYCFEFSVDNMLHNAINFKK